MTSSAIHFDKVSKRYYFTRSRPGSLLEAFVTRRTGRVREEFWALKDVSFKIEQGASVGLIGPNGSGKSTVLKLIGQVIEPTSGNIKVQGRVTGLLELGTGFHPDLTGRENIYLNASILGISRKEVNCLIDGILDFAQIGSFIDVPVRNYSSGMVLRLGFSVTTALDPEVLLIDEILAVGDLSFQRKCSRRLEELRGRGVTLLLVSHDLNQIQHMCHHVMWMDHGQIRAQGSANSILREYVANVNADDIRRFVPSVTAGADRSDRWGSYQADITSVELLDEQGEPQQVFTTDHYFHLRIHYQTQAPISQPAFGIAIYRSDGLHLNGPNSVLEGHEIARIDGSGYVDYVVERLPLTAGRYELSVAIYNHDSTVAYDHHHRLYSFEVQSHMLRPEQGIIHIAANWRHVPDD